MQTLKVLIEFTPFVNFLMNDNSCCCCTNATKTESAHRERRIYGSPPAGRDAANVKSTDPGRNVLMHYNNRYNCKLIFKQFLVAYEAKGMKEEVSLNHWHSSQTWYLQCSYIQSYKISEVQKHDASSSMPVENTSTHSWVAQNGRHWSVHPVWLEGCWKMLRAVALLETENVGMLEMRVTGGTLESSPLNPWYYRCGCPVCTWNHWRAISY